MTVIFFIHTPRDPLSAVYRHVEERACALQQRGHSAVIVVPEDLRGNRKQGARSTLLWFALAVARFLVHLHRKPDLVIFHSYAGWVFNLIRHVARTKVKTVTQFHGLEPLAYKATRELSQRTGMRLGTRYRAFHGSVMPLLLRLSCRFSDLVLCLNEKERTYLIDHQWVHAGHVQVVANAVPSEFFLEREYAREGRILIFIGQWLPNKGVGDLVMAFETLAIKDHRLRLVCLGTRLAEEKVRACFAPTVQAQVEVHSEVSREEIVDHATQADLFVLPTISEGFSVALLEAMASGLPIVTTPVGAAPDLLANGQSAMFVPVGDAAALARQVGELLGNAACRERLGRSAQEVAGRFSSDVVLGHYCELLESLTFGRNEARPRGIGAA